MDNANRISLTPTVARQTPRNEFGNVLKNTLEKAGQVGGAVSGALMNSIPGGGIISAAVSSVTALANSGPANVASASAAASGVVNVGGGIPGRGTGGSTALSPLEVAGGGGAPDSVGGMVQQMRAEADRSMMMQMNMQQESREYNAISNVLKVRHDSAKAAINNIR